uniref:Uncharacterized protein n=1 Tax=viral metagenome TaxID=1070528 RepID=A0A6C0AE79_9ZZZZ
MNELHKYTNNEEYCDLIKELKKKAEKHKINFKNLEEKCKKNINDTGVIYQVNEAANMINKNNDTSKCSSDALIAGKSQIEMEKIINKLNNKGMPILCILEITRQIFDEELKDSKPLIVKT